MSERKPPGVSWQTWIDRQIEQGRANGAFDGLPGEGKPIQGIERPRDELWWVRDKLKREGLEYLPPAIAIRKEAADARAEAVAARSEAAAREIIEDINARIRYLNSHTVDGPPTTLMPLDVDEVVEAWRANRSADPPPATEPRGEDPADERARREPTRARPPSRIWQFLRDMRPGER